MGVLFVCHICTWYFLNFIAFFHAVSSKKNRCVCVCVCTYTGSFITMPDMVTLSYRKLSSAMTSCDRCNAQDINKRNTLFACEFQLSLSKSKDTIQIGCRMGWYLEEYQARVGRYLGRKVFLADCARACKQQASRKFPGANDTVCSSFSSYTFSGWWRGAKSWAWNGRRERYSSFM